MTTLIYSLKGDGKMANKMIKDLLEKKKEVEKAVANLSDIDKLMLKSFISAEKTHLNSLASLSRGREERTKYFFVYNKGHLDYNKYHIVRAKSKQESIRLARDYSCKDFALKDFNSIRIEDLFETPEDLVVTIDSF